MTTPKDKWISVKDAMPTETDINRRNIILLAMDSAEQVHDCGYKLNKQEFIKLPSFTKLEKVTHWMLLSKPKMK